MQVDVRSEIGELEGVIVHTPGHEVENMTPTNAERALYSDILNLSVANKEYSQFINALKKVTKVYEVKNLLTDVLKIKEAKQSIINSICTNEEVQCLKDYLFSLTTAELSTQLIEGVSVIKDTLTKFLSKERYSLLPLHNFFFTRDPSIAIGDSVLIAKMSSKVREREALIMETIFNYHPQFKTRTLNPVRTGPIDPSVTIEGGDILVVKENLLCIGTGARTTTQGIDFILDQYKDRKENIDILVQELPQTMESFIHLDMVFTLLDKDSCLSYEPVVFNIHNYQTVHIKIDNGKVKWIREEANLLEALKKENIDLNPISCGGNSDDWIQEREQWHSGANFFAFAPGKVIGYGRNNYTIEALNNAGYEIISADELDKVEIDKIDKLVVTVEGSELSRGGGGCRCMTMPVKRKTIDW